MNFTFNKNLWSVKDIEEFNKYLKTLSLPNKIKWTSNLLQTKYPVLAIPTPVLRKIAKEILKGNYISFLERNNTETNENILVSGIILSQINDFDTFKKYLIPYTKICDSWAHTDILTIKTKGQEKSFINLAKSLLNSKHTFTRRTALVIILKSITKETIDDIFEICNSLYKETEYYVNMAASWLLCECFIKLRDKTLEFLNNNTLNTFTINHMIQKCRDSFRITKEDKTMLLKFKK